MSKVIVEKLDSFGSVLKSKTFDYDQDAQDFFDKLFEEQHKKGHDHVLKKTVKKDTECTFSNGIVLRVKHTL